MNRIETRRKALSSAIAFALGVITTISPVAWSSSLPDLSVFANAKEVPDAVLGGMRGRYISRDQIVQFGVEMQTTWRTAQGEILQADANLNVSNINTSMPAVTFAPNLSIASSETTSPPPTTSSTTNVVSSNGAIHDISGAAQVSQVAGDRNRVQQDTNILITTEAQPAPSGGASNPGTQTVTSSISGASVSASLGDNGVSVEARIPDQGEVIQRIRGTNISGRRASGMIQSTQLTSNEQVIRNSINIIVQVSPSASLGAASAGASLQNLRGLRPMGVY